MGAAGVEIPEWINETTVERAFARAMKAQRLRHEPFAQKGMRAARARDSRLLKALEGGAEVLQAIQERQHGRTMRTTSKESHKSDLTEYALWREAFRAADEGRPLEHLRWYYGAAAELAGL